MKKLILFAVIAGLLAGCYYDNEETLYPSVEKGCDTTSVTYSKTIQPILQTNCYGCHSIKDNASLGGNNNLEDFTSLKQIVGDGHFYLSIIQDPRHTPMPKNGAKLDTCSITKIKIWIDHGALNN